MTHKAMGMLRSTLPGGLTPESLLAASDETVKTCIASV